jgi:RPA family protein
MSEEPTRQVAKRAFAAEFNDATYTFTESDDEQAPQFVLLPTGEKANRVFFVGTLTETEDVGKDDTEYWQGRIVDPNGDTFFVYAGRYQPEIAATLQDAEPPMYVSVVAKPRTYETDGGIINVSARPEALNEVGKRTRDRWVVETAERTIDRIKQTGDGGKYVEMANEQYDSEPADYQEKAIAALESLDAE